MDKFINLSNFLLLFLLIHHCVGPPTKNKPGDHNNEPEVSAMNLEEIGIEYNRYLKEVVEALESDPEFRKKLETAQEADFRTGKIAAELEYVNHHVRTKLDELKRAELDRLKDLVRKAEELEKNEINVKHSNPGHVDHTNPHTFEVADLQKLIVQLRHDLSEVDEKRRQEFKEYEMQKKFEEEQAMKAMDEEHRKQYLHDLEEQKKKHQQHDPLHHPGSKAQLEEVWEKEDHMEQKFNPRTFFLLHDINGDGYWDDDEVKALFVKELDKLYEAGAPEDDMREREEEMERMREHVFKESDTNGDRQISYQEFLEQTKKQEFQKDEGWETIDSQPQYSQQEYEEFERLRQQEIQRLIQEGRLQPHPPGMMPPPAYQQHPGMAQQQYHQPGMPQQYGQNVVYHPAGVQPQYPAHGGQYAGHQQFGGAPQYPHEVPRPGMNAQNNPPIPPNNAAPAPPNQQGIPQIKPATHDNQQIPTYQGSVPVPQNIPQKQQQPPQGNAPMNNNIPGQAQQAPPSPQAQNQQQQQYQHNQIGINSNSNQQVPNLQVKQQQPIQNQVPNQQVNQIPQAGQPVQQMPNHAGYGNAPVHQQQQQAPYQQQNQFNSNANKVQGKDVPSH